MIEIVPVLALHDNYAYLIHEPQSGRTAVVDPSESAPVWRVLAARGWKLDLILNTHHHHDHVGGNLELKQKTGCTIIGPVGNVGQIPGMDHPVKDGERVALGEVELTAIGIPGHTLGHTAYWCREAGAVFTGDTLFLMGCGRLFEGTPAQMWQSLGRLAELPESTKVYCGHEYTEKNGEFALTLEPDNQALRARMARVRDLRRSGTPTVPGVLAEEKATNPFLRADEPSLRRATGLGTPVEVLAEIRRRKDAFV